MATLILSILIWIWYANLARWSFLHQTPCVSDDFPSLLSAGEVTRCCNLLAQNTASFHCGWNIAACCWPYGKVVSPTIHCEDVPWCTHSSLFAPTWLRDVTGKSGKSVNNSSSIAMVKTRAGMVSTQGHPSLLEMLMGWRYLRVLEVQTAFTPPIWRDCKDGECKRQP